jgi:hypothetical protein
MVIIEIANKNYENSCIRSTSGEKLVALCLGQKRHGSAEEHSEHYQDADSIEGRVAVPNRGKLVHRDHGKDKQDEYDQRDDHADKLLDT